MSEQLTLEGLLTPPSEQSNSTKIPAKRRSARAHVDPAIEARINALIEQKKKAEILLGESAPKPVAAAAASNAAAPDETPAGEIPLDETLPASEPQPEVLTVSSLNKSIKNLLEKNFPFLWVKGEISNFKMPGSGHLYFTLKDSNSQIRAVMFRGFAQSLKFKPEDGMEVLVRCRVTAYEPRGDYQLFCEVMEPVGFGALQVAFEKLKKALQAEGLFDQARKRPLPAFPTRIAIVTSPTGAAIRDMLNVLSRRFGGGLDITIIPASVQGEKAPGEIVKAIEMVNFLGTARFDVLIVGRGGGSLEDLWAFNMEEVARAVAACKVPTISAVGHEVDFTICDFVADLRAPTPSAAAELVVKNKKDLVDRIAMMERHLIHQMNKKLQLTRTHFEGLGKRMVDPKRRLQDLMLRCDEWTERLLQSMRRFLENSATSIKFLREKLGSPERRLELSRQKLRHHEDRLRIAMQTLIQNRHNSLAKTAGMLDGLSPLAVLGRGYSIVKKDSLIVKNAAEVQRGDVVTVKLQFGEFKSEVL